VRRGGRGKVAGWAAAQERERGRGGGDWAEHAERRKGRKNKKIKKKSIFFFKYIFQMHFSN